MKLQVLNGDHSYYRTRQTIVYKTKATLNRYIYITSYKHRKGKTTTPETIKEFKNPYYLVKL